ncbi:proline-specific peptidase [Xylariomycetidae sp. FL2044]|nr:proline-specific peptidase [Xylariomycetidae sp. FL2044]
MRPVFESELEWKFGGKTPCKTWFKVVGNLDDQSGPALIGLHGGPGAGHEYLSPLYDLYEQDGIPIILYDQVGCGRSTHFRDRLGDAAFWTFDLFIQELDSLIDHLKLRDSGFFLFGQSWGGMLAGVFAARRPRGLKKLILASAPASFPLYAKGCRKLLAQLPEDVRKTIEECERRGDFESPEFQEASAVFYARHFCRIEPMPEDIQAGFAHLEEDSTTYLTMSGPSEFTITGSLKEWEIGSSAKDIEVETLLLNSVFDEAQDLCIQPWFEAIPKVKWVTLQNSSHMLHWEERERASSLCLTFLVGY